MHCISSFRYTNTGKSKVSQPIVEPKSRKCLLRWLQCTIGTTNTVGSIDTVGSVKTISFGVIFQGSTGFLDRRHRSCRYSEQCAITSTVGVVLIGIL